jgi:hypothetical protein
MPHWMQSNEEIAGCTCHYLQSVVPARYSASFHSFREFTFTLHVYGRLSRLEFS